MPQLLTVEEYLEQERYSPVKRDYVAGHLVAFAGASRRHNRIVRRLATHLIRASEGTPCEVFIVDFLVRASTDLLYYPDLMVVCDPGDTNDRYSEWPCLLIEVLSPSTVDRDRHEKLVVYRNIPSLRGYMMVEQDFPYVELHERTENGWQVRQLRENDSVDVPCLPLELVVDDIYAGLPESG